jgi:hypothetical protein
MKLLNIFKRKKSNQEKPISQISSQKISVKVYKGLGGEIRALKAQYTAEEQRDEFGELVSINDEANHKEDVDFQMESIYNELKVLLNLRAKSPEQRKKLLEKKIRKQEKLIFFLNKVPELNAIYNYQDEWGKLRDYRVLKNYLKLDRSGSYFYIEDGIRTYEFDAVDGFLIPRWHGNDTYSSHPDHTRIKKIKIQEDLRFQQEMQGVKLDTKLVNYGFIFLLINFLLLGAIAYGGYWVMNKGADLDQPLNELRQKCIDETIQINQEYGSLVREAINTRKAILNKSLVKESEKNQNNIKDLSPNSN